MCASPYNNVGGLTPRSLGKWTLWGHSKKQERSIFGNWEALKIEVVGELEKPEKK